ncbi:MAG: Na+/H+ antiporter NhaA [Acidobacteriota bacterium]|nr:Na+/H+ antiporter NhaA [Acidobacteriota bacterium]MDH3528339.1 Na+/H+ antiporter NhaA [Acidobacteriota bacterium]
MLRRVKLTRSFTEFFDNEKSAGLMLILCSIVSLIIANSFFGASYLGFWKTYVGGLTISYWVNDGLMAIFFLLIGLELKRELFEGELSDFKNALLPIVAALGGVTLPALIHFYFNYGLPTSSGFGIPMATDIAFALSILALIGSRAPASLKVFLTAVAVIDDLVAIVIIAVFYTSDLSFTYLGLALAVFAILMVFNYFKFMRLPIYLVGGAILWVFMLKSGVHATIAGVLLAFTIPYTPEVDDDDALSYLEHLLNKPVAFFIMPVFALANTGIIIGAGWAEELITPNSLGIIIGLLVGKVIGVSAASFVCVKIGICRLPKYLKWKHIIGAGFLAGIGFTMSIFITNLAFENLGNGEGLINSSKMAILLTSLASGLVGYIWLVTLSRLSTEADRNEALIYEDEDED